MRVHGAKEGHGVSNALDSFDLESFDAVRMFAALAPEETPPVTAKGEFPAAEISTERLLLRAYSEADIEDHAAMFDYDRMRLWSNLPSPYTLEHSRIWCTQTAGEIRVSGEGICWAVASRITGRLLGCTAFYRTDWLNRVTEITAAGAPWAIGQGYAKEACRAMSRWALLDQGFN